MRFTRSSRDQYKILVNIQTMLRDVHPDRSDGESVATHSQLSEYVLTELRALGLKIANEKTQRTNIPSIRKEC